MRLFYEATRDAGFWNLHWTITNQPPNSDKIWQQWQSVRNPSFLTPTASAECDELSALYAFLVGRTGVKGKSIHEYARRDAPDSFEFPKLLFDFFLSQVDKYAGASDSTLQQLRYLREGVFLKYWTPEAAAQDALRRRGDLRSGPAEDLAAFQGFAEDMRSKPRP